MSFVVNRIKGDTYPVEISIRQGSGPYDLTGTTVTLTVGKTIPSANGMSWSMNATSIANSKATFALTPDIYNLDVGKWFGQLQITDGNGYIWTPAQFPWVVKPAI